MQCSPKGIYPKICCYKGPPRRELPEVPYVENHPNKRFFDNQQCGTRMNDGETYKFFQYPWMALLKYQHIEGEPEERFLCSGTIISSRYILTAAQCNYQKNFRLIGVRVGDYDVSKERDCELDENGHEVCADRYQEFDVEKFYSHPEFNLMGLENDIALIRLNDTIKFNLQNIKPICLPFSFDGSIDFPRRIFSRIDEMDVSGWGMTTNDTMRSSELQSVRLNLIPNEYCKKIYSHGTYGSFRYKQLCAGGQIDVEHPCNGDLGGPLHANEGRFTYQHGVTSYGRIPCDTKLLPGVYTSVVYYMDWILNTMTD
ncbi:serine protease grass isoform X2 [Monomorium pharaonis]|nr:serine protease grass isoform X2 [Monomorium pharaonis]